MENYVPILRWKQAEKAALAKLDSEIHARTTPFFEFIMPGPVRDKDDFKKIIIDPRTRFRLDVPKIIKEINKCHSSGSAFIDMHLIDWDMKNEAFEYVLSRSREANAALIPVTYIFPDQSTQADMDMRNIAVKYAKQNGTGLCVRIDRSSLNDDMLAENIENFLHTNNLNVSTTDLFIDLGIVDSSDSVAEIEKMLARLPLIDQWRSFVLSGGAFPKDLTEFEKHSHPEIPRFDWLLWRDIRDRKKISRIPTYSDYTIQHPVFYGNVSSINVSASVRYTNDTQWDIIRGEGLRNEDGAGHAQYIAHAKLLIQQDFFKGSGYCFGDDYIVERAQPDNKNTGNPMTWIRAGINHHIALTVKSL